ncbi:MAG: hypothetical protein G01um101419_791 [Parcubacteria group bacterium Gr01-1014_19]|nr:MAG: hypothetical protein G01um101419_791 [Parcubacteria group bacterium Gr01-1014_19]
MNHVHVDKIAQDEKKRIVLIRVSMEGHWAEFRRVVNGKREMRCNETGPSYRGQQVEIPKRIWRRLTSKAAARMFEGESVAKQKPVAAKPKPGELF